VGDPELRADMVEARERPAKRERAARGSLELARRRDGGGERRERDCVALEKPGQFRAPPPPEIKSPEGKRRITGYTTDVITDLALQWLEEERDGSLALIVREERVLRRRARWQRAAMLLGTLILVAGGYLGHRITSAATAFPPAEVCVVLPFPLDGTWTVVAPAATRDPGSREVVLVAEGPALASLRLHVPAIADVRADAAGLVLGMDGGVEVRLPGVTRRPAAPDGAMTETDSRTIEVRIPVEDMGSGTDRAVVRLLARRASDATDRLLPMRFSDVEHRREYRWTVEDGAVLLPGDRVRRGPSAAASRGLRAGGRSPRSGRPSRAGQVDRLSRSSTTGAGITGVPAISRRPRTLPATTRFGNRRISSSVWGRI